MSKYVLLTGSTGMLGEYLLCDLLSQGHRLAVIVRPNRKVTARERVETILQRWEAEKGRLLPRPVCLTGDLSEEYLGLDKASYDWVAENCDTLFHNAAVLTFHTDVNGEPWKTNVEGTRKALKLCEDCGIRKLHYVSTAYVCGIRDDVVREEELDTGQDFRNDYERSKFQSETLVREAAFIDKLTVYRPAIIVGDSRTGYMATYHGLGMYLRLMSLMIWNLEPDEHGVRHTPLHLPCNGDEPRNPVAVDWVSEVMSRLFNNSAAHGGTYHITPDVPMTARQLIDYTGTYFNCRGVVYAADSIGVNEFDALAHEHLSIYHDYLMTDPTFDRTNMRKFVPDLPSPVVDEEMIHRYLRFGEDDRWGKRRPDKPTVQVWVDDCLQDMCCGVSRRGAGANGSTRTRTIGIDVRGPGGSQASLRARGHQLVDARAGLPSDGAPIVRMTTDEFAEFAAGGSAAALLEHVMLKIDNQSCESTNSLVADLFDAAQNEPAVSN